jgi:5'-methylthioadenosine phosphorylase
MNLPAIFETQNGATIGVFGGSGFYSLLEGNVEEVSIQTPYGPPSDTFVLGRIGETRVAFLPRHGSQHRLPPHAINYRANLWGMASLGVKRIISPAAAGSLQPHVKPGDFVVCDQLVDRTYGRAQTYFDGPRVVHVSTADPYCPELRELAVEVATAQDITVHTTGTVVVVQGPRFSTRAESKWFSSQGWEVINMTAYPEVALARELEMCYVSIALITDYDAGLEGHADIEAVTVENVIRVLNANNERVRGVIEVLAQRIPAERDCPCSRALQFAVVS